METTSPNAAKRRFLPRFGLRALFIILTVAACGSAWLGMQIHRCTEEEQAIAKLSAPNDGRSINLLFANPFGSIDKGASGEPGTSEAFFRGGPKWLTWLVGSDIFRTYVKFQCVPPGNTFTWDGGEDGRMIYIYDYKTGLRDADMVWVNKLIYLRLLGLEANGISNIGLARPDNLGYVENLSLSSTAITDEGLVSLKNFPALRVLDLRGTNISDAAISLIAACEQLEVLKIAMTNITSQGVKLLQERLPRCKIEHSR